jgi:hypothetical protein
MDRKVENAKITVEGNNLAYDQVLKLINEGGGAVHSIDEVAAGRMIIDDAQTLQDPLV